ncbi:MAG: hypothetical protein LC808_19140 [Actinobacteria bacterium]|nr:hypothetical protein [Actinomycetota bacterium]
MAQEQRRADAAQLLARKDLDSLSDGEFRQVIAAFIRNEIDADTRQALLERPLVERTRLALESMAASVSSQLDARAADMDVLEAERRAGSGLNDAQMHRMELDYARWRASALRFQGHLREILAGLPTPRADRLEAAIRVHRDTVDGEGDVVDEALWAEIE